MLLTVAILEKPLNITFSSLKNSIKSFYVYYLIILFFIIALFLSPFTTEVIGDVINLLFTISFIVLYILKVNTLDKFYLFRDYFLKTFSVLFGLYLILRFIILAYNNEISSFFLIFNNTENFDRNSYTLNLWISIITIFSVIRNIVAKKWTIPANIYLFFLLILVLFSASRRGIVLLVIFSVGFVIWQLYLFIKNKSFRTKYSFLFLMYLTSFLLLISTIIIPANARNIIFENTVNDAKTKSNITQTLRRYYILVVPNTTHKEFKKILWDEGNNSSYTPKIESLIVKDDARNITNIINDIQRLWGVTNNKDSLLGLLPELTLEQRSILNNKSILYLPEISKLPYEYTHFFSCLDIEYLELINYLKDETDFPFRFSFNKDTAAINLKLPALANSIYKLDFIIKAVNNPIRNVEIDTNEVFITQNIIKEINQYTYSYTINTNDNNADFIELSIALQNNVDSFDISDLRWSLIETNNNEEPKVIYAKLQKPLKKFKFEQSRSIWLWAYYFNAEKLSNTEEYIVRNAKDVISSLDNIFSSITPRNYTKTVVTNDSIIFTANTYFPRMRFNLPVIQNSVLQLDLDYELSDTTQNLLTYIKRSPEIINIYLEKTILLDSIIKYNQFSYKRIIRLRIDSINTARLIFSLGLKKLKKSQTLVFNSYKFKLVPNNDSIYLSNAQFNFINQWSTRISEGIFRKNERDSFNLLVETEKEKEYWEIDTNIYQYASADRLELWLFGWQYFKSLPWYRKVFGDGFNYYKIYKLRFGSKYNYKKEYFPHNPILSALLYSGILGAIAYLFFLFQVIYYYYKYHKGLGIMTLIFVLTAMYAFVSNRSHFTDTYLIIFTLFPFVLHSINSTNPTEKEKI